MTGSCVQTDDALLLQFGDYVLDSSFAEPGQPAKVRIAAAIDPVVGALRLGVCKHQAVNGILPGRQPVGNPPQRPHPPEPTSSTIYYRRIFLALRPLQCNQRCNILCYCGTLCSCGR